MSIFDEIEDDIDEIDTEVRDLLSDVDDIFDDYEDALWKRDQLAVATANRNIALLYQERDIEQFQAKRLEDQVDAYLEAAGHAAYFENLPDDQRPSEMYDTEDYEPTGFVEKIGAKIWGDI